MAPSSIRKGKIAPDDAISQRVSYLYDATRSFAASAPALAAHLGRELLKIAKDAPRSVTRDPLQSLCPRCGYPWDSPDQDRPRGAKSTALKLSKCRLCSWVRTTKMHVDKLPAGVGGKHRPSSRHGPVQSQGNEASAAETVSTQEAAMQRRSGAECTLDVIQDPAEEAGPHASFSSHDWGPEPDVQDAPASGKGASQPASVEALNCATAAAVEEPGVACQQLQLSKQELRPSAEQEPPSGAHEMPHNAPHADGPQEARTLLNAALVTSSAEDAGRRLLAEHGSDCGEAVHQAGQDAQSAGGAQSCLAEGAQQGIIEQVMHLMSPQLPISLAMERAAELVKHDGLMHRPRWFHKRRRGQSKADRYRWRKVGRGWRRHIF